MVPAALESIPTAGIDRDSGTVIESSTGAISLNGTGGGGSGNAQIGVW